jgi:hypothetical protein
MTEPAYPLRFMDGLRVVQYERFSFCDGGSAYMDICMSDLRT